MSLLLRNATILTMNDAREIIEGDVLVRAGTIAAVGAVEESADRVIDLRGAYVLPGFVQTHVHLCQTLFRSFADDLPLLDWLRLRVWPLEAAHDDVRGTGVIVACVHASFDEHERCGSHDTRLSLDLLQHLRPIGLRHRVRGLILGATGQLREVAKQRLLLLRRLGLSLR